MNYKKLIVYISVFAMVGLMFGSIAQNTQASVLGEIDDAADFEEEIIRVYADIYYNSSGALNIMGVEDYTPTFEVRRGIIGAGMIQTWDQGLDFEATIHLVQYDFMEQQAYTGETGNDYFGFNNREIESRAQWSQYNLVSEGTASHELYNSSTTDDTTLPTSNGDYYIRPDDTTQLPGIEYEAGDGKSPIQISEDLALYEGYQHENIVNFTTILFGFNDLDDLVNLNLNFDDTSNLMPGFGINAFTIRRKAIELFSKIKSGATNKLVTISDTFQRIGSNLISGLKELPAKATHIAKKTIGSAWHNLKVGLKAFGGGIAKSLWAWIMSPIVLISALAIGALIIMKRRR